MKEDKTTPLRNMTRFLSKISRQLNRNSSAFSNSPKCRLRFLEILPLQAESEKTHIAHKTHVNIIIYM